MMLYKCTSTFSKDPDIQGAICNISTSNCVKGQSLPIGNGPMTGRCIPSAAKPGLNVCEVSAWCPVERDILPL